MKQALHSTAAPAQAAGSWREQPDRQLNSRLMAALRGVIDTLIPSVEGRPDRPDFWRRKASDLEVEQRVLDVMESLPRAARWEFRLLLVLLASPLPGLLLGRRPGSFAGLPGTQREALLLAWSCSRLPLWRKAFASMKRITCFIFYGASSAGVNPNWSAIGYPAPAPAARTLPPPAALRISEPASHIDCDTLVIGSGAGGGLVAAVLAERRVDTVLVDKGDYLPAEQRSNEEFEMVSRLYEDRGMQTTSDHAISLFAGACLGGGTLVNWCVSLRPGDSLLHEWARGHDLPHLLSRQFSECVETVCQRIGVVDQVPHNLQNRALLEGSARLGLVAGALPQNVRGCERDGHEPCGHCLFGCRFGHKQDTTEAFLRPAQQGGAPIRIHPRTQVHTLHHHHGEVTHAAARVRAPDGSSRPVLIRAKRFVLAAGAIQTPALLLASGFVHTHLGRHLHVHPVNLVIGRYAKRMESWRGGMMTSYCDAAADPEGDGYGCKIETAPLHSGLLAAALPWRGGAAHKQLMLAASHYAGFAVINRDRHGGHVRIDGDRRARVHYRMHEDDRRKALQGMAAAAAIHAAAGAEEVLTTHQEGLCFDGSRGPQSLQAYLAALSARDWSANRSPLFSAHLMGSCRMGGRRAESPVMPDGRLHGTSNLYVADGSVFPSASGINPMVTIQSLALHTALGMT